MALVERGDELRSIHAALQRRRGLLVVEGPAGVGKTALLDAAAAQAADAGLPVLRGRGHALERDLPFGVAEQWLPHASGRRRFVDALPEPVVLIGDDLHWADVASLRLLLYAVDRLDAVLILAVRTPFAGGELLELAARAEVLAPQPLSFAGVQAIVDTDAGTIHRSSGGIPFYVRELARWGGDGTPARITHAIAARCERAGASGLARAIAVLGDDAPLHLAARLAGLDTAAAATAADELRAEGVLGADGFLHPIVREAVLEATWPGERTLLHARAARLVSGPERVAAHLLEAEPDGDPWAVAQLREAARSAIAKGAPESAVGYLRRAFGFDPSAGYELGTAEALMMDPAAVEHLRDALDGLEPGARRVATRRLAQLLALFGRVPEALSVIDSEAEQPLVVGYARLTLSGRAQTLDLARSLPDRTPTDPVGMAQVAAELTMHAPDRPRALALARRALAAGPDGHTEAVALRVLFAAGAHEEAGAGIDAALERAQAEGRRLDVGVLLNFRADLHERLGRLGAAEADARAALDLAEAHDWPMGRCAAAAALGRVLIARDELAAARAVLAVEAPDLYTHNLVLEARAELHLAAGEPDLASAVLAELGERCEAWGERNPALVRWRAPLGRVDEELELARAFGAPLPIAAALTARGDYAEALALLEGTGARLHQVRALIGLGGREHLLAALDLADACGATALARQATDALHGLGARPRRARRSGPAALTPSERRVAELAATGASNRDIAAELVVTVRTVEYHLSRSYGKLGIDSRRALAAALSPSGIS